MSHLAQSLAEFVALLEKGRTLDAMERFYDEEVVVFENRALARAGRTACLAMEREHLALQRGPSSVKVLKCASDEGRGVAFLEYVVRFTTSGGRPMRLEEVAVQRWHGGKIVEERFYYEGLVDEGDAGLPPSTGQ